MNVCISLDRCTNMQNTQKLYEEGTSRSNLQTVNWNLWVPLKDAEEVDYLSANTAPLPGFYFQ